MKKNITLYYVGTKGINFGDSINPLLFERIFDVCIKRGYPTNCDVVGIGSLMQMFTLRHIIKNSKYLYFLKYNHKPVVTMGTGFCCDISKFRFGVRTYREVNPLILRGKLSHEVLERVNKKKYSGVVYGDLGLLSSYLLEKKVGKRYAVGIVPHKFDYDNPKIEFLVRSIPNSVLLDLREPPLETLNKIAECETIVSSSLHGLVAADGLGIPNMRIKLSNHGFDFDVDFKFDDYNSVFSGSRRYINLIDVENIEGSLLSEFMPDKICGDYGISGSEIKSCQERLLVEGRKFFEFRPL